MDHPFLLRPFFPRKLPSIIGVVKREGRWEIIPVVADESEFDLSA